MQAKADQARSKRTPGAGRGQSIRTSLPEGTRDTRRNSCIARGLQIGEWPPDLIGNVVGQVAESSHAELSVLCPVTRATQWPAQARICRNSRSWVAVWLCAHEAYRGPHGPSWL